VTEGRGHSNLQYYSNFKDWEGFAHLTKVFND
jgi:hypothetical protein